MKASKLILITGMSGAGKSTTARQLAEQYRQNGIAYRWLHEEIKDHPIREGEFTVDRLDTEEGMAKNMAAMYERWSRLTDKIERSDAVYIMEGCLYSNIIRYFFANNYPWERIVRFYDRVLEITARLDPTIVFLYRSDIRTTLQQAFSVRGDKWKNLILQPEGEGYFNHHPYTGDESVYAMWEEYQQCTNTLFERYQGRKIKLHTSDGQWDQHLRELTEYLGLSYQPPLVTPLANPEQYCGRFVLNGEGERGLSFKVVNQMLYCQLSWWSNMCLTPMGNHAFEALSFPIKFVFHLDGPETTVDVQGNYDWQLSGRRLKKL